MCRRIPGCRKEGGGVGVAGVELGGRGQGVRPLLMTVGMNILGLLPVMLDTGVGSDVAKRIAAPLWGGLVSLTLLTLVVIPALWLLWRERSLPAA